MSRLFIYSLIFIVIITISLTSVISFTHPHQEYQLPIHKTLYLDRFMYDNEIDHIISASIEWHEVTNGQVSFDIKRLPQDNLDINNAVIVSNTTPDNPDIIMLDAINGYSTLGFTNRNELPYILLVNERLEDSYFHGVVMHELGHILGLEHPSNKLDGIGTLMYPTIDLQSQHLTEIDLIQFCQLYNCNYKLFHIEIDNNTL